KGDTASRRWRDRRLSGPPTGPSRAAGEEDWARRRQQRGRSAVGQLFLLRRCRQSRVRKEEPCGDQAGPASDLESLRPLRRRARPRRAGGRGKRLYEELRLRASDDERGPYGKWREYDPEDTVRFYALRLREVGMITASPQKIITQGSDWRFLN